MNLSTRYRKSAELLARAERVIPLGSQTFSKSKIQYPAGAAPMFLTKGAGGRVWDVDGNEYVDLVCALLPVVLGYRDPDVDAAIRAQLENGISFSLATELEIELAEKLAQIIPCAEMVRFGKNASDATSAAVRLARAFTGHDHVIACGYHGWQDWYIGATARNKGVPAVVAQLTHKVPFNDLGAVEAVFQAHPSDVAAIMLETVGADEPAPGYLQALKEIAHRNGALLVFDETITGFRIALGGAQAYYGVTPDLAAFGKAMGNGMPISAIVGRRDVMREMEEIFFSATFGGETLSMAAALAVIDKMQREAVIERLWKTGAGLAARIERRIAEAGLQDTIRLKGIPPWKIVQFVDGRGTRKEAIKTLFVKEMLRHGVLITGTHNICYAHDERDIEAVERAWQLALGTIAEELATGLLEKRLGVPVIMPVFAVRG
jgi:glutamate-1-semialdehyde 2,1-aminomutase/spore coat polysaccharide biosynthesis protein SpsF